MHEDTASGTPLFQALPPSLALSHSLHTLPPPTSLPHSFLFPKKTSFKSRPERNIVFHNHFVLGTELVRTLLANNDIYLPVTEVGYGEFPVHPSQVI